MSEVKDYKKFRDKVILVWDRCDRIENIMVIGMPDVNCCIACRESWIEIKSPKEPKRATTKLFGSNHKLPQDQINWFMRQANAGGNGYILICSDNHWILMNGCKYADEINTMTVSQLIEKSEYSFKLGPRGVVYEHLASEMRDYLAGFEYGI